MPPATGADVADNAGISAYGIAIDGMVDGSVAYAHFLHGLDDVFEGLEVVERVAVHFHIADVAAVGKGVVRSFKTDLVEGIDGEVHRNVEGVGVVVPVGDARNVAEQLAVVLDESAGKTFGGRSDDGKVETRFLALGVRALADGAHDAQAEFLSFLGFAVMNADERLEAFGKSDEAGGQRAVLEAVGEEYGMTFTPSESKKFSIQSTFGVNIKQMKSFLALPEAKMDEILKTQGIPTDSVDNQFKVWVKKAREINPDLRIAIKADQATPYKVIKNVMNSLQDLKENRYNLITSLKAVSEEE